MDQKDIKKRVKKAYGEIAESDTGCGCGGGCCPNTKEMTNSIGYSKEELKSVPDGANLGLGCGNPVALASLKKGETVLDLGSGAGFDCFLASEKAGSQGKVIGVDMTPEMISKARQNAQKVKRKNIEFRLGEIENLPVADNSVDVVISNCVINLSADKSRVFSEIHRVLKKDGRVALSDIALLKELPKKVREDIKAYVGCVAGAVKIEQYEKLMRKAGLKKVKITVKGSSDCITTDTKDPIGKMFVKSFGNSIASYIVSVYAEGYK